MDAPPASPPPPYPRYVDAGINLTDSVYASIYDGEQIHAPDLESLLSRAADTKVTHIVILGTDLASSRSAIDLTDHSTDLFTTIGISPKNTGPPIPSPDDITSLRTLALSSCRVRALGPIGLDYTGPHNATAQLMLFRAQLDLAEEMEYLPLVLIVRGDGAFADFAAELFPRLRAGKLLKGGVVGSWTGTVEEMDACIAKGLYIGISGCSVEMEEGLGVVKRVPLGRLCVSSDGPALLYDEKGFAVEGWPAVSKQEWREDRWVEGRNEPGAVKILVEVIAKLLGEPVGAVAETIWHNSQDIFKFPIVQPTELRSFREPDGSMTTVRVCLPDPPYPRQYRDELQAMLKKITEAGDLPTKLNLEKALQLAEDGV